MAQQEPWDQGWDAEVAVPSWTSFWLQWLVAGRRHRGGGAAFAARAVVHSTHGHESTLQVIHTKFVFHAALNQWLSTRDPIQGLPSSWSTKN